MPLPALFLPALIGAAGSALGGIARGKAAEQQALQQNAQSQIERELLQRQMQQAGLNARLGYLSSAQQQEQNLAAQRLAAMDLGKLQGFESQQAVREGLSDAARNWKGPGGMSPAAAAFAAQQPNLLAPFASERFRQSVGQGRTQESIADYTGRVNELRRNQALDTESRASLDQLQQILSQALPNIPPAQRAGFLSTLLSGLAAGGQAFGQIYGMGQAFGADGGGGGGSNAAVLQAVMGGVRPNFAVPQTDYSSDVAGQINRLGSQATRSQFGGWSGGTNRAPQTGLF